MLSLYQSCMLSYTVFLLFVSVVKTTESAPNWNTLNETVGGRLHKAKPFSSPCFPDFDGISVPRNKAACKIIEDNYLNATYRSSQFGNFMNTQWESCMSTSAQCTLDSSDPSDSLAWTELPCDQGSIAPYYIDVQNYEDVQAALAFSRTTEVPCRSSTIGSLGLWTRNLDKISYNASFVPVGGSQPFPAMTIGAGVPWVDAYSFADANNVTIVGGYSETVGASGGWIMGGGHSVLSPTLGLGVDRVLEYKLVTPDGEYRTANAHTNSDLFWALRGGGGGTFGVVLESTSMVEPMAIPLQVASVSFNSTTETGLQFLRLLTNNSLQWAQEGWGGHLTSSGFISVTPLLTLEEAQASMQNAVDFVQTQNGTVVIETLPSWFAFFAKYTIPAQTAVGSADLAASRLIPYSLFETQEGRDSFIQLVTSLPGSFLEIDVVTPFLYNATENSTSVTPAWRNAVWHVLMGSEFVWNSTLAEKVAAFEFTNNCTAGLISIAPNSGAYMCLTTHFFLFQNEANVYEPNYEQSFWGGNYDRLLAIKHRYDPLGLLDCWKCVGWKGVDDSRSRCYPRVD
ncbi:hypothetical protein BDP27DRAFT_1406835 [Rhodocollybia butyracea]|uniref:FAD-binding PCMH-type domain-containing protein n=1 Tax=Rhodocollybia butyracea TaxID=206335 RepID=A0A9P5U134_9AGAR|nr:hypothetical protein BDP27DRAFT_1406835 [Rhodocollybia butyracea]